jgi:hypothetical protein
LAGAAIEALLHWKLGQLSPTERADAISKAVAKGTKPPPNEFDKWSLEDFIPIADQLGAIRSDAVKLPLSPAIFAILFIRGAVHAYRKNATELRLYQPLPVLSMSSTIYPDGATHWHGEDMPVAAKAGPIAACIPAQAGFGRHNCDHEFKNARTLHRSWV